MRNRFHIDVINDELGRLNEGRIVDKEVFSALRKYLETEFAPKLEKEPITWQSFSTVWPPRLVDAYQNGKLVCFFGSGLSVPSGLPDWNTLLSEYFGLEKSLLSDDDLRTDPLTLAELASHQIGSEHLQFVLRQALSRLQIPSTNHFITASLRLPFYITTNYDCLFETAWTLLSPSIELVSLVNEADLIQHIGGNGRLEPSTSRSYLLKIHGSIERDNEHLILTRSDYRYHYRANQDFFNCIEELLSDYHILFLGFSHKDPEVTRLVEDVIYKSEKEDLEEQQEQTRERSPNLYSLQFNMSLHTPEIFAARGIMALTPPVVSPNVRDFRSLALAQALIELIGAADKDFHSSQSLDKFLKEYTLKLTSELQSGLNKMAGREAQALETLVDGPNSCEWLAELQDDLGPLAGQGVYLLNDQGRIIHMELPDGLNEDARKSSIVSLSKRPYFQQARTFRKPFISDSAMSIFNRLSTFFLCVPLTKDGGFAGLLFSACQIGFWRLPVDIAREIWDSSGNLSIFIIDSNGVCLLPPNDEIEIKQFGGAGGIESPEKNQGYLFSDLLKLSRRDKLVSRIMQNVVPIYQDDDILHLSPDLRYYTVVTELKPTRWKLAISRAIEVINT